MIELKKLDDTEIMGVKEKLLLALNPVAKLTDWKNEPSINELKNDFTQAQSHHSKFLAKLAYWENLYNAPKYGNKNHKGSRVNPKLVRKQAEWAIPALTEPFLSTEDLFDIKPLTFDDVGRAKQNALILNRQFSTQLNKTKLVDNIVRQLVRKGTCIVRVGWEYKEKEVEVQVEQFEYSIVPKLDPMQIQLMQQMGQEVQDPSQELQQQYEQLTQLRQQNPDSYEQTDPALKAGFEMTEQTGQLLTAKSVGFNKELQTKVVCNKPTIQLCDLKSVYIDPTCQGDMNKAQFVIHSYESSLSELKQLNRYRNLDKLTLNEVSQSDGVFRFSDKARQKLTVYEYWGYWDIDKTGMVKPIIATWVGDVLIRMEENPFPDGKLPFVVFNYLPEEDDIYGIPNAELLGDNQEILGAVMRGMIDLMGKSANSQTGYAKNMLDNTNKAKFANGMDYEFNQGFNPQSHIYTHKYPEIPQSAMLMVQMMNNEAESISGVKAFSGTGISASNLGDVAAGVRGVLDAVSKREMSILRRISSGFIELGRKIIAMNAEFLSEQEVVRITNEEFITIRRDDLAGEFDLSLTISTAEGDDAKAQELAFMLQTLGNNMGQDLVKLIMSQIAQLRKMPDLAKMIEQYQPEPDPISEEMRQLDVEYRKAEIELMRAEAQERLAKSQVQDAKVGTEQAKAESLKGDVHQKAYEQAERETGYKEEMNTQNQLLNHQLEQDKQNQLHNQSLENLLTQKMLNDTDNEYATYQQQGLNQ